MKFLASQEGHFNPMQVEAVIYETQGYTMHHYDGEVEYRTQYTIYAVMTSGQKIPITCWVDKDWPELEIQNVLAGVLNSIEEALS